MPEQATQLLDFWYAVARSTDVRQRPLERHLAGRALAVFRDASGRAVVLSARCPHRGGNLARGRWHGDGLACPYHGWRFDSEGRCVAIPSLPPGGKIPQKACVPSLPVREQSGVVWTTLSASPSDIPEPPSLPGLSDTSLHAFGIEESVAVPFDWWAENILDNAHVPFVHRATYGGQDPIIESYRVTRRPDHLGFCARTTLRQRYHLLARLLHRSVRHFTMEIEVTHEMPATTVFTIDLGRGRRQILVFLASPEDGDRTRAWIFVLRNYLVFPGTDWIGRWFTRAVVREDERLARAACSRISLEHPDQVSVPCDEPAVEFVRLLRHWREREARQNRVSFLA